MDELVEPEDLKTLVADYLRSLSLTSSHLNGIVNFYTEIRQQAASRLVDGTGHKPHYRCHIPFLSPDVVVFLQLRCMRI